ncbi:hypothetical protein MLPF_2680 [Mycobacterium lepromatosis]|nr:hypothetical protein MLPF_2680 [Mycobacterium lepromatosis]
MVRNADTLSHVYGVGIPDGVLVFDDQALREVEDALQNAERCSDDLTWTPDSDTVTHCTIASPN